MEIIYSGSIFHTDRKGYQVLNSYDFERHALSELPDIITDMRIATETDCTIEELENFNDFMTSITAFQGNELLTKLFVVDCLDIHPEAQPFVDDRFPFPKKPFPHLILNSIDEKENKKRSIVFFMGITYYDYVNRTIPTFEHEVSKSPLQMYLDCYLQPFQIEYNKPGRKATSYFNIARILTPGKFKPSTLNAEEI